jgi:hypothetical protein
MFALCRRRQRADQERLLEFREFERFQQRRNQQN